MAEWPELVVELDNPALTRAVADWMVERIGEAVRARGRCSLALAGGSTPRPIYADLSNRPTGQIAWDKVEIFFGDERAVPPDHADSNFRMAREALLGRVPLKEAQIHRMAAERPDLDKAAEEYAAALPGALDILFLGMGPDGHTASLVPGSPALDESKRLVMPVIGPKPPPKRLTITPPVIGAARRIAVVAVGPDKAEMVKRGLEEGNASPRDIPIRLARRGAWFVDKQAASLMRKSP